MIDDLFPDFFKIVVKLLDGIGDFFLLRFGEGVSFLVEVALAFVELFLAFPPGLLIHLVISVALLEVEVAIV